MTSGTNGHNSHSIPTPSLQALAPIGVFLVVNRLAGLRWAVVAATAWSIKVLVDRRRSGLPLGRFVPIATAAVILRGAIGVATDSETVYFGLGIATKYAVALVLVLSVLLGTSLASRAAPFVLALPDRAAEHPIYLSTMTQITLIGALYYTVSASFDVWLFRRSTVEGFVVIRFLANWPLAAVALISVLGLAQRRLPLIAGITSVSALLEQQLAPKTATTSQETTRHDD